MRGRLRAAVGELLADPELEAAPDAVRLAAVVLLAKSNAAELCAQVTAGELGRWLGLTGSQVSHAVRPRLQRGPVRSEDTCVPGSRRTASIRWEVARLVWARHHGRADHPLRLTRPELATLLRLCEALFGPGWTATPPGLLAARRGHGAATDRLGMLLAVLNARPDGTVRLCGGAVDPRGRLAATMARLLNCDTAAGERVLARLEVCEVVAVPAGARERLVVPAVAAAYRRMRAAVRAAGRAPLKRCSAPRGSSVAGEATAGVDQIPAPAANSQAKAGFDGDVSEEASAALHAHHSPMAEVVEESASGNGFSGEAPSGCGGPPGRAGARKGHAHTADEATDHGQLQATAGSNALRAEEHNPLVLSRSTCQRVPLVADLLSQVVGEVNGFERHMMDRLVRGLLLEGETDEMIAARLRKRLAPLATGGSRPWAFRTSGVRWALRIGLPYVPGGLTLVPCSSRGCSQLVQARVPDRVRCEDCEIAAMDAALADRQGVPSLAELERMISRPAAPAPRAGEADGPCVAELVAQPAAAGPEKTVLPSVVREQLDIIAGVDPAAARAAERAAAAMYGPVDEDETDDAHRYRTSKATADFHAITGRFADVLTAHYQREEACA